MWLDDKDFAGWQHWEGHDWPTDDGVPERCGFRCMVIRKAVLWEGKDGEKKKCWRYQVLHGSHVATPSVTRETLICLPDHGKLAAGDKD